jgi:pimeloyl-ACP methyl ester carboxylesterase
MKTFNQLLLLLFIGFFIFTSCDKNNGDDDIVPKYLVDFEAYPSELTADGIKSLIQLAAMEMPGIDVSPLTEKVKYDVEVHKIVYKTLFEGDTIFASGIVATPVQINKKDVFPVMSYQHGTIFQKSEAPSENISREIMTYLASTGMAVVIPDYIGFGASSAEFHPYMHNQYTVNAVLDMIRASKEFIKTEKPCDINDHLFMFGYSQGGSATVGALSAIENNNSNSDLKVNAAVAGAGAYDLAQFRRWIIDQQRYDKPSFVLYIMESLTRYAGVNNAFDEVFSPGLNIETEGLIDGIQTEQLINNSFGTFHVGSLFTEDFIDKENFETNENFESLRSAFASNKVSGWKTTTPLNIYFGLDDTWVPGEQSIRLFQEFQDNNVGSKVNLVPLQGLDHLTAFFPSLMGAVDMFLNYEE